MPDICSRHFDAGCRYKDLDSDEVTRHEETCAHRVPLTKDASALCASPMEPSQDWHSAVTSDLRNHFVHKL
jgi:hypothetical protein